MKIKHKSRLKKQKRPKKTGATNKKQERSLILKEVSETGEYEIQKKSSSAEITKKVSFPKTSEELYKKTPEEFRNVMTAIDVYNYETRKVEVHSDSLESFLGYDSLMRVMGKYFGQQVAYYHSAEGGSLSIEQARKEVYRKKISDEEAEELFIRLMKIPSESISFWNLQELNDNSPAMAQNLWEMIKRDAALEFESGHRAAAALEPADYMIDAWNRASYIGLRESLCEEWQPKGGIELTMIDAIAQAWLMLQHWTEESVRRAKTRPREEDHQFREWKKWQTAKSAKQWDDGFWDIPYVYEQKAIEHAAQMADRWQRMYFRAIRNLRDWRRYTPQLNIKNANQVNIATDGGQQVNVSNTEKKK
ncbi:MAG: hypothetical protein M3405_01820 [Acidobacteriota bacterium]|jgi:predicted Zn-dependent protease with MMP-like domain|nr:hypothetical protein [Acidobacteriota bacterium]